MQIFTCQIRHVHVLSSNELFTIGGLAFGCQLPTFNIQPPTYNFKSYPSNFLGGVVYPSSRAPKSWCQNHSWSSIRDFFTKAGESDLKSTSRPFLSTRLQGWGTLHEMRRAEATKAEAGPYKRCEGYPFSCFR